MEGIAATLLIHAQSMNYVEGLCLSPWKFGECSSLARNAFQESGDALKFWCSA